MPQTAITNFFKAKKPTGINLDDLKGSGVKDTVREVTKDLPKELTKDVPKQTTTNKNPSKSTAEKVEESKVKEDAGIRVKFVKKGSLSPVKKVQPQMDLKRLKGVVRNFNDSAKTLQRLREQRKAAEVPVAAKRLKKADVIELGEVVQKEDDVVTPASPAKTVTAAITTAHPTLPLPHRLKILKLLNEGMNTVSSMFQNRNETITFNKLKPAVENMTKHTFTLRSIARMLSVDQYFHVIVQKIENRNQYVLEFKVKLLPSQLLRLKKNFDSRLMEMCLVEHEKFLRTQKIEVDRHLITRWHPSFNVDGIQIPLAELPDLNERLTSAAEVLNQVREMMQSRNRGLSCAASPEKKPPTPRMQKEAKGIASSLLERIRAKEKNRIVKELTMPQEELKLLKIKSRLPELVRIIHNIFVGEKKTAIDLPTFLQRLQFSYQKLTTTELQLHLDYLVKSQSTWIEQIKTTSGAYVKINRSIEVNDLVF